MHSVSCHPEPAFTGLVHLLGNTGLTSTLFATPRFETSANVIAIVFDKATGKPATVVKISRRPGVNLQLKHEAAMLEQVRERKQGHVSGIPTLLAYSQVADHDVLTETAIDGEPMNHRMIRKNGNECIAIVMDWLVQLHSATVVESPEDSTPWDNPALSDQLRPLVAMPDCSGLPLLIRCCADQLRNTRIPTVFEHGDLSDPNILLLPRRGVGVIDWELAHPYGLPVADFFFFLAYVAASRKKCHTTAQYLAAFRHAFFGRSAWCRRYVHDFAARTQIPGHALRSLFVLCWVRHAAAFLLRTRAVHTGIPRCFNERVRDLFRQHRLCLYLRHTCEYFDDLSF
jgi:aminoglycoside phosphotransferase